MFDINDGDDVDIMCRLLLLSVSSVREIWNYHQDSGDNDSSGITTSVLFVVEIKLVGLWRGCNDSTTVYCT